MLENIESAGIPDEATLARTGGAYVPAEILFDPELSPNAKLLYGRIFSLQHPERGCYASNRWLGEGMGLKPSAVARIIYELVTRGYLEREVVSAPGQNTTRSLWVTPRRGNAASKDRALGMRRTEQTAPTESGELAGAGGREGVAKRGGKRDPGEQDPRALEVLAELNRACRRCFRPTPGTLKYIRGRLAEGWSVQDLCLVIAYKAAQWLDDDKMREYLRPQTLFRPEKFQAYIMAAREWEANGRPRLAGNGGRVASNVTAPEDDLMAFVRDRYGNNGAEARGGATAGGPSEGGLF